MRFADELVAPTAISVPSSKTPAKRELTMARTLVNQMSSDWDADRYTDEYRSALMKLIDKKVASGGKELPKEGHAAKRATNVIDLAEVLRESLAAAKPKKAAAGKAKARSRAA